MPWKEVTLMDERYKFVSLVLELGIPVSEVCRRMGISRKTGYKWLKRNEQDGLFGLMDQSRAPLSSPSKVDEHSKQLIFSIRNAHPSWGAPKIRAYLERKGYKKLPVVSTIGRLLKKHDFIAPKDKARIFAPSKALTQPQKINDVWSADFKGDFKSRGGTRNYPLTITDLKSRYLLCCRSQRNTAFNETKDTFTKVFNQYGLPKIIRTDNGVPFAGSGGLSQLSVWWCELGIEQEITRPGKPQDNGSHERMHRTLKAEAINVKLYDFEEQQREFEKYRKFFNHERPHAGIGNKVPGELYRSSLIKKPDRIKSYKYPEHFVVTEINGGGCFYLKQKRYYVSHTLEKKIIGLEPIAKDLWAIYFRDKMIGTYDENDSHRR